jgi:hypothetical protein
MMSTDTTAIIGMVTLVVTVFGARSFLDEVTLRFNIGTM